MFKALSTHFFLRPESLARKQFLPLFCSGENSEIGRVVFTWSGEEQRSRLLGSRQKMQQFTTTGL